LPDVRCAAATVHHTHPRAAAAWSLAARAQQGARRIRPPNRSNADRFNDYAINALEFGADPTGSADSTAAIQAAIDYAFAHFFRTVFLPAGQYKTSASLYLDPPNNLRVNFANPPRANFSMTRRRGPR
jgi:Pectate lyase superfamily protein